MDGDLRTVSQAVNPPISLGLGASWHGPNQEVFDVKDQSCLPSYKESVGLNYSSRFAAGLISKSFQIEANLELAAGGDFEFFGQFDIASLKADFEATLAGSAEKKIFYVIVRVDTATRSLTVGTGNDNQHPDYCNGAGVGADYLTWVQACGTHYVSREELGGLAVLWIEYSQLSGSIKGAIEGSFDMEVPLDELASGSVNYGLSFNSLLEADLGGLLFNVYSKGLANPLWGSGTPSDDWETFGEVVVERWVDYFNGHFDAVSDAVDNGEIDSSVLGVVLNSHLRPYTAAQYDACNYTFGYCKLGCAQAFDEEVAKFYDPKNDVQSMLTNLNFALDYPEWIHWPEFGEGEDDPISTTTGFRDRLSDCIGHIEGGQIVGTGTIHDAQAECRIQLERDQELCDHHFSCPEACDFPRECRWEELWRDYYDLPDVARIPPDWNDIIEYWRLSGSTYAQLSSINDYVCVLTGVSGRFHNGDDKVFLSQDGGNWRADVDSSDNQTSRESRGDFNCFPRALFVDNGNGLIDEESRYMMLDFPYELQNYHIGDENTFLAIGGLGGNFTSIDESVFITRQENNWGDLTWWPTIKTSQNYLQAWFWSYQFDNPAGDHTALWTKSGGVYSIHLDRQGSALDDWGRVKKDLARIEDALCFLTKISGDFAGTGESARIRPAGEYWQLQLRTEADREARVEASCVLYQQN